MKKFITFTLCLLLCVASLGLTACGGKKKETMDTSIASIGNGGMVVTRGEYVYFVNGYQGHATVYNEDNKDLKQKFNVGALYRAKLNSNGVLDYTANGSVAGAEKLTDKLVGFENTSLYVFGNYVYYATPYDEVDGNGNLKTDRLKFNRIKIDGGKPQCIYKSTSKGTEVDFEFYYAEGNVYLAVKDGNTLNSVQCFGDFKRKEIATDMESLVLARDTDDVFKSDSYKNVFYTKTANGNIEIFNCNIVTGKTEYKSTTDYASCELVDYKFGYLYYKAHREQSPSYKYYYRIPANKNAIQNLEEQQITKTEYETFYFLENETSGYIAQSSGKTYYLTYNGENKSDAKLISNSKLDIIATENDYIYFNSGSEIKRINCYNVKIGGDAEEESVVTVEGLQSFDYDIDDNNLYVYATAGSHTYLYSIYIGNSVAEQEIEQKLLGVYENGDTPTK